MRDIRPNRPVPGRAIDSGRELYEVSAAAKKRVKADAGASSGATVAPKPRARGVPVNKISVAREPTQLATHSDREHQVKSKRMVGKKRPAKQRIGSGERKAMVVVFILVLLSGAIATYLFLPTATLALQLKTAPLLVDEEVKVSGSGEVAVGEAYFREVAVNGSIPVTNREKVGSKATGQVSLINRSTEEQPIREQSRLVTSDGQLFYMQRHAIVAPNASVTVQVEAAEAGEAGNIEPQRLDFAALDSGSQQLIYAEAKENFTGGSGEEVAVVSETDIQEAQRNAGQTAKSQVESEIRGELPAGWDLIEESWVGEIANFVPEAELGERTPELAYQASVVVRVMGIEQEQLLNHLRENLQAHLDEEFMLFPGPISYSKSVKDVDWEKGETTLAVRVTHTTIPNLDLETLKAKLAGRSAEEAREYLEGLPGVISVDIKLWPFWVQNIPRIEKRISLELTPDKQPQS